MVNTKTSLSWILLAKVLFCLALRQELITPDRKLYVVKNPSTHELTCISEDDDAALVWNYDLNTSEPFNHFNNFKPLKPMKRISSDSECAVWRSNRCLTKWVDSHNLETVSSLTNPMAPVVDYRWEGFEEHVANNQTPMNVLQLSSTDGTVVFSIRGRQNVEIYLCRRGVFRTSFCYLIKIAVDGDYSIIENCQPKKGLCQEEARSAIHESAILDAHEWRTFRLQLIRSEQKIKVFRGTDENAFLEGNLRQSRSMNNIWIRSGPVARIRFHNYNYILFTEQHMPSTTLKFDWPDNFCINMLVSICPSCRLTVGLTGDDTALTDNSRSITGDEQFYQSGLRTWRTVELNFSSSSSSTSRVGLYFIPGLNGGNHEDIWWAIDNLRLCESNDGIRKSTITLPLSDCTKTGLNIKCQKLLRDETVVADLYNRPSLQNTGRFGEYIQRFIQSFLLNNTPECNGTSEKYIKKKTADREPRGVRCFDVIPGKTSLELQKASDFPVCQEDEGSYSFIVNDVRKYQPLVKQTCPQFPCGYYSLEPFTAYNVVVKAYSGRILLDETVTTLESAPGKIRDLSFESISATSVTGKWNPPDQVNGNIRNYTVSIERVELLGCRDYKKPSPLVPEIIKNVTSTMASFSDLHPYARYRFQVIANTIEPGPPISKEFETAQLDIPTSNVSNLRFINESRFAWDFPTDCTTITGRTKITKLIFWGVSEWAKNWSDYSSTSYQTLDLIRLKLLPYTEYRVCAFVVRDYGRQENSSNCQPYLWRTKPAASPAVKNLEIYEADALGRTISVEWEPPYPPTGKIESYQMSIMNRDKTITNRSIEVSKLKKCRQSHVCVKSWSLPSNISVNDDLTLQIFARNANVTKDGGTLQRWFKLDDLYNEAPGQPEQLKVTSREYGTVTLQWAHPSLTPTKIVRFQIQADCLRTNLTTIPCKDILPIYYDITNPEEKRKSYSTELYLLTSTEYRLYVRALNYRNETSAPITKNVSTSGSVSFASKDELRVINTSDVVALEVPAVLNATRNTTIVIKVEGLSLCAPNSSRNESSSKSKTKITMNWDAVKYSVYGSQPVNLTFELNKYYGVEQKCRFQHLETYIFNAILKDPGLEEPLILKTILVSFTEHKPSEKQSQIWLVIISILVICLLLLILFIFYRNHKKTKMQTNDSQGVSSDLRNSIHVNSRVQLSDVQDLQADPVHTASSKNLEGHTSCAQNVPLESPYMIPRNPSEQTSHLQNVALAPVSMNISNDSREELSHVQNVPSDPVYWEILDNSRKQPSHPQDIALDPLYMNTLDNSKGESSYPRDASMDPEYLTILDDSREETSYAQDIPLVPVYMNILDYSREQTHHARDTSRHS